MMMPTFDDERINEKTEEKLVLYWGRKEKLKS